VPELTETVDVDAPPEQVWAALVDWVRTDEWMLATDVRTVGGPAHEVGGVLEARTGVPVPGRGHVGLLDRMEITSWDPPRRVAVRHVGRVVRGSGVFEVRPRGTGATLAWTEDVDLPLGVLGRLGWPLVRPATSVGLRISLRRFAAFARQHPA
jgi:carbon monoxide dehydrogenase subunit G